MPTKRQNHCSMPACHEEHAIASRAPASAVGGVATALGAFGVLVSSVFYALAPPAVALPGPLDPSIAQAAAEQGTGMMQAAGTVGMLSDVFLAAGAILVASDFVRRRRGVAAVGWLILALGVIVFIVVDALASAVLSDAAKMNGSALIGFKLLFDALFVLGTLASGVGAAVAMSAEIVAPRPLVGSMTARIGAAAGSMAVVTATGCLGAMPWGEAAGVSVAILSMVFAVAGMKLARSAARCVDPQHVSNPPLALDTEGTRKQTTGG